MRRPPPTWRGIVYPERADCSHCPTDRENRTIVWSDNKHSGQPLAQRVAGNAASCDRSNSHSKDDRACLSICCIGCIGLRWALQQDCPLVLAHLAACR